MDWLAGARLAAVLLIAAGIGLASVRVAASGACALAMVVLAAGRWPDSRAFAPFEHQKHESSKRSRRSAVRCSRSPRSRCWSCARDSIRAQPGQARRHLRALWDVIGRRQYDVAGLWPRQAPSGCSRELVRVRRLAVRARTRRTASSPTWWRTPITDRLRGARRRSAARGIAAHAAKLARAARALRLRHARGSSST